MPYRYDHATEARLPVHDVSKAKTFGQLIDGCSQRVSSRDLDYDAALMELRTTIQRHFRDGDYIVCCGDPILIAAAAHYAAEQGRVVMLRYDRFNRSYFPMELSYERNDVEVAAAH